LFIICVVLYASSFNLTAIVESQRGNIFGILNGHIFNPLLWPMAVVYFRFGFGRDQPSAV